MTTPKGIERVCSIEREMRHTDRRAFSCVVPEHFLVRKKFLYWTALKLGVFSESVPNAGGELCSNSKTSTQDNKVYGMFC